MPKDKINVLVVDDSSVVRQMLKKIIDEDDELALMAVAQDPYIAAEKLKQGVPDVITLDVEMPRMDGVTFLKRIMTQHPIPVVICSSLVGDGSQTLMNALEAGAVDIIKKPEIGTQRFFEESRIQIADAIKAASSVRVRARTRQKKQPEKKARAKLSADAMLAKPKTNSMVETTEKVIVIGSSTGGTDAVRYILESMPLGCPGIVIVQHMPEGFTKTFADRVNESSQILVKEARDGENILRGQALIAPGGKHLLLKRSGARYYVQVKDGPLVSRHRPSVDVLFRSAARYGGKNIVAAILTGMGDDGANGMKEIFDTGALTVAQDEATSVVYGMPKEAVKRGGVNTILPLDKIPGALIRGA